MPGPGTNRAFLSGLVGGILGALLFATMPAVTAAVGDAINLGELNTGNAVTSIRGSSVATLRLQNQEAGSPALDLRVAAGSPPLKVDSGRKVAHLNADKVDGRSSNQIARVAFAQIGPAPGGDGDLVTATIVAPTDGYLVMSGSLSLWGLAYDMVQCSLAIRQGGHTQFYGHRDVVVEDPGGDHTSNAYEVCATNAAAPVPRGTYDVSLRISFWTSANFGGASVWAVFVPFDGAGLVPDPEPW